MKLVTGSFAEAEETRDLLDKARGFPEGGYPADQPWARARGIGQTVHQCDVEREPGGDRFALDVPDDLEAFADGAATRGRISANERGRIRAAQTHVQDGYPSDWARQGSQSRLNHRPT